MGAVRLLTYREVAAHYRVAERTVRHWAQKGAIEVVKTPGGAPRVAMRGNADEQAVVEEEQQAHTA